MTSFTARTPAILGSVMLGVAMVAATPWASADDGVVPCSGESYPMAASGMCQRSVGTSAGEWFAAINHGPTSVGDVMVDVAVDGELIVRWICDFTGPRYTCDLASWVPAGIEPGGRPRLRFDAPKDFVATVVFLGRGCRLVNDCDSELRVIPTGTFTVEFSPEPLPG
jgi:hypothetical protein